MTNDDPICVQGDRLCSDVQGIDLTPLVLTAAGAVLVAAVIVITIVLIRRRSSRRS